jgi:hypothetical protein
MLDFMLRMSNRSLRPLVSFPCIESCWREFEECLPLCCDLKWVLGLYVRYILQACEQFFHIRP